MLENLGHWFCCLLSQQRVLLTQFQKGDFCMVLVILRGGVMASESTSEVLKVVLQALL